MEKRRRKGISSTDMKIIMLIVIMIIFAVIANIMNPRFLSPANIINILYQYSVVGVMAVGMMMIIIIGGIDLSMGYSVAFGAIVCGTIFTNTGNVWLSLIAAVCSCTLIGFLNGVIITKMKIAPFIATLATMSLTQGALNMIGSGLRLMLNHEVFNMIGKSKVFGISTETIIMVLIMMIGAVVLNKTKFGAYIYAIGSDEDNARLAGINVEKYKVITYASGGFCVGLASVLLGSKLTLVMQSSAGSAQLMDCIAAVVIGGTSMSGGSGKISGTFLGVILLGMIGNMLTLLKIPTVAQDFFKGIVIILALALSIFSSMIQKRNAMKADSQIGHQADHA